MYTVCLHRIHNNGCASAVHVWRRLTSLKRGEPVWITRGKDRNLCLDNRLNWIIHRLLYLRYLSCWKKEMEACKENAGGIEHIIGRIRNLLQCVFCNTLTTGEKILLCGHVVCNKCTKSLECLNGISCPKDFWFTLTIPVLECEGVAQNLGIVNSELIQKMPCRREIRSLLTNYAMYMESYGLFHCDICYMRLEKLSVMACGHNIYVCLAQDGWVRRIEKAVFAAGHPIKIWWTEEPTWDASSPAPTSYVRRLGISRRRCRDISPHA